MLGDWFDDILRDYLIPASLVVTGCVLAVLIYAAYDDMCGDKHALYDAWRKANPRVEITYEEWNALRNARLLGNYRGGYYK